MTDEINFMTDFGPKKNSSIIKVIGVGGGGGNAVKHMYSEGIKGVDFLVCNTDRVALEGSPIPAQLVFGEGLGAGADPNKGRELAEESIEALKKFIGDETKMLFVTAGMGKGTGTGASPIVAKVAKEMQILTIGVVTAPFQFEGKITAQNAREGIEKLKEHVDSLIVIENNNLMKHFEDLELEQAYSSADDVLKNAVKCIAELINVRLAQNIDFNDIKSIMSNSGTAMLGLAEASGEDRVKQVFDKALSCPLLQEEQVRNAKNFLFSVSYGTAKKLKINELDELTTLFETIQSEDVRVIWGHNAEEQLEDKIKLSVIATGFRSDPPPKVGGVGTASQPQRPPIHTPPPFSPPYVGQPPIYPSSPNHAGSYPNEQVPPQYPPQQQQGGGTQVAQPQTGYPHFESGPVLIGREADFENTEEFKRIIETPAIFAQPLSQERETVVSNQSAVSETPSNANQALHKYFKSFPD